MEVVTKILESNLVSAIIALIGVIISLKWSTGETTKRMEKGQIWNLKYFRVLVKIVEKYYK